jgi:hypothetical protein
MASNGRLPASMLAPIAGGRLRKDAALRWNAMNLHRRRQGLSTILPNGPFSSYRDFAGQVLMRNQWCARGVCGNAAIPGTSNHGLGIAVDNNNPAGVEASGPPFGWSKRWSDAPWESWHVKWAGFGRTITQRFYERTIRRGKNNKDVRKLKWYLTVLGYRKPTKKKPDSFFSRATVRQVKEFQRDHNLKPDGIVGPNTWAALRRAYKNRRK